jgi:hypothetical protein
LRFSALPAHLVDLLPASSPPGAFLLALAVDVVGIFLLSTFFVTRRADIYQARQQAFDLLAKGDVDDKELQRFRERLIELAAYRDADLVDDRRREVQAVARKRTNSRRGDRS